ncbi:MAG: SDR family NAD(P)-dependent oxidoreductase [Acetobacteraceae bacterium]
MTYPTYPDLRGRTVIITGGASGIGEAFVRAFVANDARVAFLDLQADAGESLAAETGASFMQCDLTDTAALRTAIESVVPLLGPASMLVNNAANDQRQDFEEVSKDDFDWMMAVNFRHVYFAAQAVLPQMRTVGRGSIVSMSSIAWMGGGPRLQAYAAAKAAVVGFTNSLARDVGGDRIRVNAIAPGMVITERQRRLWYQDESRITAMRARQCTPDLIEPADIAQTALFLASDASRAITKQCLIVNAGSR